MLKVAIERAIEKSPHYDLAGNLFNADHEIYKHFVGFVSSYTQVNVLTSFHLHSFVTFYIDSDSNTVETCSLTTKHHILSNMQDCLLQLLQWCNFGRLNLLMSLTSTVIGSDVKINQDSIHGYTGLGFDMSNFKEDSSDDVYTIGISMTIRMVQFGNYFTWSKYSCPLFPNNLSKMMILEMNNAMSYSIKTRLSFFKLTLIDLKIFHWMQSSFSHLKNAWRLFIHLHWTLIKYLPFGIEFFVILKQWSLLLKKYGNVQGK